MSRGRAWGVAVRSRVSWRLQFGAAAGKRWRRVASAGMGHGDDVTCGAARPGAGRGAADRLRGRIRACAGVGGQVRLAGMRGVALGAPCPVRAGALLCARTEEARGTRG